MNNQTLAQELDALAKYGAIKREIPNFVKEGINPKILLRPYQEEALSRFFFYIDNYEQRTKPTHLLFHMATGSGKTVIMASNILFLYSLGYRNFLFFVNSTNIIEKTKDNFLNSNSIKYLFNEHLKINNKNVKIVEQNNFQHIRTDDINIVFTTIQGLHSDLTTPKENSLTFEDFEDKKIVLLSDEAHHINALTKKSLGQTEIEVEGTWENTVQRIFKANSENMLLEYTATVDMEHIKIKEKYEPKLIYKYTLKEFREDKYSKEVKVLESDTDNLQRALQAIILSQYRRKVAQDNKIYLKPVVLFKSKTIKESESFENAFYEYLSSLRTIDLEKIGNKQIPILNKAFEYFRQNKISISSLIKELQEEFSEDKCVSVNSQNESEEKQILVNTLESENNEIRAIFAVDKLNEGWDVLNLFDIVRLYNTRDAKGSKVGKTTMAEAQLIGRGARYFPFQLEDTQEKYQRKYDEDIENDLRVLEELYYHSAYNPKYIWELNQALVETGMKAKEEKEIELRLKEAFKSTDFWMKEIVYANELLENKNKDKKSVYDYNINQIYKYDLGTGFSRESSIFNFELEVSPSQDTKTYTLADLGGNVIQKAVDKIDFFHFSSFKHKIPNYKSITEFISEIADKTRIEVTGNSKSVLNLSQEEKLDIALSVFSGIKNKIMDTSTEYIGTKIFKAYAVRDIFTDKTLKINVDEDSDKEIGKSMNNSTNSSLQLDLFNSDWYAYEDDYGTSEEKYLVKFISTAIENLKKRYEDIFLVRNAKALKIFEFNTGRAFEPDYILFLKSLSTKKKLYYQIFIEPKGGHLLKNDEWKEDFLKSISAEAKPEVIHSDKKYSLIGLPFYNEEVTKLEFVNAFEQSIP